MQDFCKLQDFAEVLRWERIAAAEVFIGELYLPGCGFFAGAEVMLAEILEGILGYQIIRKFTLMSQVVVMR